MLCRMEIDNVHTVTVYLQFMFRKAVLKFHLISRNSVSRGHCTYCVSACELDNLAVSLLHYKVIQSRLKPNMVSFLTRNPLVLCCA